MTIEQLKDFFMWCTVINGSWLILTILLLVPLKDFAFRVHSKLFGISREAFNNIIYSYLAALKIFFLIFSLTPYLALILMG